MSAATVDAGDASPLHWTDRGLRLIDQRRLPEQEVWLEYNDAASVATAIRDMVVRGAPAIGLAAAYGVVLAARSAWREHGEAWREHIGADLDLLRSARPTAVNLAWAVARLEGEFPAVTADPEPHLLGVALDMQVADVAANRRMGAIGAELLGTGARVLTHCNAGALATGGYGTALGVLRAAHQRHSLAAVYATETRPWLQGARLTAWELSRAGIPFELIADGAAAWLMRSRGLDWVVVGADRIAANGDVANKIGTYALAVAARANGVRFMVVAPLATFDAALPSGAAIEVESRSEDELLGVRGRRLAAPGTRGWNPVFDVTPAALVDAIVTERGAVTQPNSASLAQLAAVT